MIKLHGNTKWAVHEQYQKDKAQGKKEVDIFTEQKHSMVLTQ